jgi:hypothetical protein
VLVREATRTAAAEAVETDEKIDEEAGKEADGEVEEEMDTDNVDEMDGATEAAPNQSAASARPEKLGRFQKACLEFCIALLDHQITRKEYDSPLVCALAVLGVEEEGWKGPEQYPLRLSAVNKTARFMVVQQELELLGADLADPQNDGGEEMEDFDDSAYASGPSLSLCRHPKGCLQLVQQMMDRFMVRGSHGLMQWMLDLRTYRLKIHCNTTSRGHVEWTGDKLLYKKLHYSMVQVCGMVRGLATESQQLLTEELLFSKAMPVPAVPWESMRDNPTD